MSDIDRDTYSNQTIQSLVRSCLETIIDDRSNAVILVKVRETKNFQNLLNRLKYTDIKVYGYGGNLEEFKKIELNIPQMENDEFFIIIAERFSAGLYWNKPDSIRNELHQNNASQEIFGLSEGFCSLNPAETKKIIEHLQAAAYSEDLEKDLSEILQDRRNNEKFTVILRKIVLDLENRQRDLICANTELKELHKTSGDNEKLASISQLFSTIMHELRNPLGSINLHTKIISKKLEALQNTNQEEIKNILESVELISRTSLNLEKTLGELLDFSKPISLEKTKLNFETAVKEIINLIKPSYENKNVGLIFKNSLNNNFLVNFDRAKLHQVIFNILKNALEISEPQSNVEVLLTDEENSICLKISDQGPGIPAKSREKIFEPYFTTKKEGTGLGLAQARKIIKAHDGNLYVDPNSISGAVFIISLPAASLQVNTISG